MQQIKKTMFPRKLLSALLAVLLAVVLLPGMLTLTALIPQDALRENMLSSAEYLRDSLQIYPLYPDLERSTYDHYADEILLSIAWHYDAENPVSSVAESKYYDSDSAPTHAALYQSLEKGLDANQQYIRYWHGSILLLRPLMLLFDLEEIYVLNGVLLGALFLWLLIRLLRRREYALTAALLVATLAVASYFIPIALEYVWTYYIWLIVCHVLLGLETRRQEETPWLLFLLSGIFTAFMDFLTTETLTLTVPLLMLLYLRKKHCQTDNRQLLCLAGKNIGSWAIGYVGMWSYKWLFASLVLKINAMDYVRDSVTERLGGLNRGLTLHGAGRAIRNNLRVMLTGNRQNAVSLSTSLIVLLILAAAIYVYRKKAPDFKFIGVLAVFVPIPYLRYAVLQNHSTIHCFFTFRAQLVTVMALVLIFIEVIEWRFNTKKHGASRRRRS